MIFSLCFTALSLRCLFISSTNVARSLYSESNDNHCPIFFKQKRNEIKIKDLKHLKKCDQRDCICKNKLSKGKDSFKCAFFDPKKNKVFLFVINLIFYLSINNFTLIK